MKLIALFLLAAPMTPTFASEPEGLLLMEPNESVVHQSGRDLIITEMPRGRKHRIPGTTGVPFASLSRDGCKLAYINHGGLYIGTWQDLKFSSVPIPNLFARKFQWSADGAKLVLNFGTYDLQRSTFTRYPDQRPRIMREALSDKLKESYVRYPNSYSVQQSYSPDLQTSVVFGFNGDPGRAVLLGKEKATVLPDRSPPWAWSADGELFINGREDGSFLIFNAQTGQSQQLAIPNFKPEPGEALGSVTFSPDKKWLAFTRAHGEDLLKALSGRYAFSYIVNIDGSLLSSVGKGTVLSWAEKPGANACK